VAQFAHPSSNLFWQTQKVTLATEDFEWNFPLVLLPRCEQSNKTGFVLFTQAPLIDYS